MISVNLALVNQWATRFGATFDEYCITGLTFEIRTVNTGGNGKGLLVLFLDEKDSTAPTANDANSSARLEIELNNSYAPIRHRIDWIAKDISDLTWTSTSTSVTPVFLKAFASNVATFTANDTGADTIITGSLNVDFRGFKNG